MQVSHAGSSQVPGQERRVSCADRALPEQTVACQVTAAVLGSEASVMYVLVCG